MRLLKARLPSGLFLFSAYHECQIWRGPCTVLALFAMRRLASLVRRKTATRSATLRAFDSEINIVLLGDEGPNISRFPRNGATWSKRVGDSMTVHRVKSGTQRQICPTHQRIGRNSCRNTERLSCRQRNQIGNGTTRSGGARLRNIYALVFPANFFRACL